MSNTKIKVVGIGGSGSNAISRMAKCNLKGVELIALNTDAQALRFCLAPKKILVGKNTTKGLGTGMNVSLGKKAVLEDREKIEEVLKGADIVFVASGMGGGTGSPGAPIVAEIAKALGALTIATVTRPFSFEGIQRKKIANSALSNLKEKVDTLLVVPNDKLLKLIDEKTTVTNAFWICDEVLREAVQGVTDLILVPGIINVDSADVKTIMKDSGQALFGVGKAEGPDRAVKAALKAINSPLVDFSIKGAKRVLFNVSGQDLSLSEINKAAKVITQNIAHQAKIIFGAVRDAKLKKEEIRITVIATGFGK